MQTTIQGHAHAEGSGGKQLAPLGYKDAANIRSDTDLDALRGREDFKKLLAALGAEGH